MDIESGLCGFAVKLAAVEGEPCASLIRVICALELCSLATIGTQEICGRYSTGFPVAEVEVEGADTVCRVAGSEAVVQLEVGAAGLDGHGGVGIVQRVGGSEEEDAAVFSRDADGAVAAREAHRAVVAGDRRGRTGIDGHAGEHGVDEAGGHLRHHILAAHLPAVAEQGHEVAARGGGVSALRTSVLR